MSLVFKAHDFIGLRPRQQFDNGCLADKSLGLHEGRDLERIAEVRIHGNYATPDADALRGFFPMLKSSVEASYAFNTTVKTKKSAGCRW